MKRLAGNRGVSMIEALVALALFAIAASALGAATVGSTRGNNASKTTSQASALVHDQIEKLRSLDQTTNPADLTAGWHYHSSNPVTATGTSGGTFTLTWTVTANTPTIGLSRVTVTAFWNSPTPRSVTGVTYVCATAKCV